MPSDAIYRRHTLAIQAEYSGVKQLALSQRRVLSGTPGKLTKRTQLGKHYWVREHIRFDGKKTDEYIGPVTTTAELLSSALDKRSFSPKL